MNTTDNQRIQEITDRAEKNKCTCATCQDNKYLLCVISKQEKTIAAAMEDILSATSSGGRLPQCAYCAHRDMLFLRVANRPCDSCKWHLSSYASDNWQWRGVQQKEDV